MEPVPHYYVSKSGETRGPTTLVALQALLKAGVPDVSEDTLVWREGTEWTPLKELASAQEVSTAPMVTAGSEDEGPKAQGKRERTASDVSERTHHKRRKRKAPQNCSIYVQGLPKDVTEEEVAQFFSRCGFIRKDNDKPRIKLFTDPETGELKGDAVVTFIAPGSVFLAIQNFDESIFRDGYEIKVEEADYNQRQQEEDAREKHKGRAVDEKALRARKVRKMQERALLSWNEDSYSTKEAALLIVVLKGLFVPEELANAGDEAFAELEEDLIEGLAPICPNGDEIKKITVFKSHPEAVIVVRFKDALVAVECVKLMDGRFFDGRQIKAALWDGVTEYGSNQDVEARMAEQAQRMEKFSEWIENHDEDAEVDDGHVVE